jgi:uncharacterized hydantoinase/oxoprolinase family protein
LSSFDLTPSICPSSFCAFVGVSLSPSQLRLKFRGWAEAADGSRGDGSIAPTDSGPATSQLRLARPEYVQAVVDPAARVFCSPLKRAVQTAIVALADHPATTVSGITLLEPLREVKLRRGGGNDCVATSCGDEIAARAVAELPVRVALFFSLSVAVHTSFLFFVFF